MRLEALFGAALDALTDEDVRGLTRVGAQEAFDLEFKRTLYGGSDGDRRALAVDVAALANTAGGVIVIGVEEDHQARATAAPGVDLTDAELSRMRQIVASLVAPLPLFDLISVVDVSSSPGGGANMGSGDQSSPGHGFLLIAVPRSPNAPHAVLVNNALRYPRRNGATIRYLSEPEVAAAYRERAAGVAAQAQRILDVEREAAARLNRDEEAWLLISLTPDLPGDLVLTTATFREFQQATMGTETGIVRMSVSYQRTSVGRRRLLADGTMDNSPLAKFASLELHTDGAGAYGLQLYDMTSPRRIQLGSEGPRHQIVDDESITVATLSGLLSLAKHARDRAAAGGNAIVRATLLPATRGQSVEIGHARQGFAETRSRVALKGEDLTAEAVSPLDELATAGPTLVSTASALVDEIAQAFGIPEVGPITRDGRLRSPYWSGPWSQQVVAWAQQHGIEVTSETLTD